MDIDFGRVAVPQAGTEVELIEIVSCGNNPGPKNLLLHNYGDGIIIIRYYYSRENGDFEVMKSLDADLENEVPASPDGGTTPGKKHIVLEGSYMVERIRVTSLIKPAEVDPGSVEGCFVMPHGVGSREV